MGQHQHIASFLTLITDFCIRWASLIWAAEKRARPISDPPMTEERILRRASCMIDALQDTYRAETAAQQKCLMMPEAGAREKTLFTLFTQIVSGGRLF